MTLVHSTSYDVIDLQRFMARIRNADVAHAFQRPYQWHIHSDFEFEKSYAADFGTLKIFILRPNLRLEHHGAVEMAVLEDPKTGSHVVLRGETAKGSLAYLCGTHAFLTDSKDPVNEVSKLFALWSEIIDRHGEDWTKIKAEFKEFDPKDAIQQYLQPIWAAAAAKEEAAATAEADSVPDNSKRPLRRAAATPNDPT
jgi:hypothetical protein